MPKEVKDYGLGISSKLVWRTQECSPNGLLLYSLEGPWKSVYKKKNLIKPWTILEKKLKNPIWWPLRWKPWKSLKMFKNRGLMSERKILGKFILKKYKVTVSWILDYIVIK